MGRKWGAKGGAKGVLLLSGGLYIVAFSFFTNTLIYVYIYSTALHMAASQNHIAIVSFLLRAKADVNVVSTVQFTPLVCLKK